MLSQEDGRSWRIVGVFFDVRGLHTPGPALSRPPSVNLAVISDIATESIAETRWPGLAWARPMALLLFGVGVLLKDGDFGIILGVTRSTHARSKLASLCLGRSPSSGTLLLSALSLFPLVALVDVIDALTVTRIAVGGGGGARIVADVHVGAHVGAHVA